MKKPIILAIALHMTALASAADIVLSTGATIDSERVKSAAADYASRKYEHNNTGSTNSWAFTSGVDVDEPVAVAGWTDEWRVKGEVGVRQLTSQGGVSSPVHKFEARVAYKDGRLVVVDFSER